MSNKDYQQQISCYNYNKSIFNKREKKLVTSNLLNYLAKFNCKWIL